MGKTSADGGGENHLCGGERWTGWVKLLQRSVPVLKQILNQLFLVLLYDITRASS